MAPLRIGIVGAGPGGLTAALTLRNAGHKVDVFERSSLSKSGGFTLALGSNVIRILKGLDVPSEEIEATYYVNEVWHDGETLQCLKTESFDYCKRKYGSEWCFAERSVLQKEMMAQAATTPEGMQKIDIHLSSEVTHLEPDEKKVVLKDGSAHAFDMIVIANGVHSTHAALFHDGELPSLQWSRTAYRVSVPLSRMQEDPDLSFMWQGHDKDLITFLILEKKSLMMGGIAIRESDKEAVFGALLMSPSMKMVDGSDADYNLEVPPEEASKYVKDFHPLIQRWVSMSTNTTVWTSVYRESLDHMVRGGIVGIGDVVHAHLPHHGQGASSAIEDGASLGPFLDAKNPGLTSDTLGEYLAGWERFRKQRARFVHLLSVKWPLPLEELKEDIEKVGYKGPLPAHNQVHTEVMWDFLFGYDVVTEAKKAAASMHQG